jgi:hypothetical protein
LPKRIYPLISDQPETWLFVLNLSQMGTVLSFDLPEATTAKAEEQPAVWLIFSPL